VFFHLLGNRIRQLAAPNKAPIKSHKLTPVVLFASILPQNFADCNENFAIHIQKSKCRMKNLKNLKKALTFSSENDIIIGYKFQVANTMEFTYNKKIMINEV
jgi:hypothetical protein